MPCNHSNWNPTIVYLTNTGARPTNDTSIKIRPKFAVLWLKIFSTDHNEILHTSRQLHVCRISLWSDEHFLNQRTPNFDRISNSVEIPLLLRAPGIRHIWQETRDGTSYSSTVGRLKLRYVSTAIAKAIQQGMQSHINRLNYVAGYGMTCWISYSSSWSME